MGKFGNLAQTIFIRGLLILALLFALIIQSSCVGTVSAEKEGAIELKLAHFFPGTHPAETELVQGWAEAIKEATNGRIIITSYPGETLLKAADIYKGVVDGICDIGLSCFSYNPGRFPEIEAFEQPGIVYKNSKVASKVAWEGIQELNPESVKDTKLLMVIATGPGDLFTKKPVNKLEDIIGMQIRATGLTAETLQLTGAIPVGMPQSEAYEALSKGIVTGNLAPIEVLKTWKHGEVTRYITRTPFLYNNLFYITMNLDKWNSIPEELQDIIVDTTLKFQDEVGIGLWDRQNEDALKWAIEEEGMEVIDLSDEEMARWIKAVEPMLDKYIEEKGETGSKAVDIAKRLAEKYNKVY
ncbi:MAG: TRAP transporter substrate-binding protein [Clostridiaceae bacterium]|nr:TRAP transporter substrate-binding protein [Clostridiaceae bacterium]